MMQKLRTFWCKFNGSHVESRRWNKTKWRFLRCDLCGWESPGQNAKIIQKAKRAA